MLFDVQLSIQVLHADVVNVKVVARRYSADTIKDIFCASRPWNRVHDDIGIGQYFAHPRSNCGRHLLRALESEIAFQANRNIGKKAVPGLTETNTLHLQHAFNRADAFEDLASHPGGSGIKQSIYRSPRQTPTD